MEIKLITNLCSSFSIINILYNLKNFDTILEFIKRISFHPTLSILHPISPHLAPLFYPHFLYPCFTFILQKNFFPKNGK